MNTKVTKEEFEKQLNINSELAKRYEKEAFDYSKIKKELTIDLYCDECHCRTNHIIYGTNLRCSKCKGFGYWLTLDKKIVKTMIINHESVFEEKIIPGNIFTIIMNNDKLMGVSAHIISPDGDHGTYKIFPELYHSAGQFKWR
jgi:hypothetical protein